VIPALLILLIGDSTTGNDSDDSMVNCDFECCVEDTSQALDIVTKLRKE